MNIFFPYIVLGIHLLISGCGGPPPSSPEGGATTPDVVATPTPTPTPTATPDPDAGLTTVRFTNYFNQNSFCDVIDDWDQNATVIIFPRDSTKAHDLIYKRGKVYEVVHGDETVDASELFTFVTTMVYHGNSPGCTVRYDGNGNFVRVDP